MCLDLVRIAVKEFTTGPGIAHGPFLEQVEQYVGEFRNTVILGIQIIIGNHFHSFPSISSPVRNYFACDCNANKKKRHPPRIAVQKGNPAPASDYYLPLETISLLAEAVYLYCDYRSFSGDIVISSPARPGR
jgi:hypothetical protein